MNLLCGVMGVILTMEGRPDLGFVLMICGAVFDFFDGLAARLLKASSGILGGSRKMLFCGRTCFNRIFRERYGLTPAEYRRRSAAPPA